MQGVTLFPASSYIHTPVIQARTKDAPQNVPSHSLWLFKNLPCLNVNTNMTIESTSAARMYVNCRFKSNGDITHMSPQLVNYLAKCYDMVKFPDGPIDLHRVYTTIRPPKVQTNIKSRTNKREIQKNISRSNSWKCCSAFHSHSTNNDTIHVDSVCSTEVEMCTTCYYKLFDKAPHNWFPVLSLDRFLKKDFYTNVIQPLIGKQVGAILRGYVYLQGEPPSPINTVLSAGIDIYKNPGIWAIKYGQNKNNDIQQWINVSRPKHAAGLKIVKVAGKRLAKTAQGKYAAALQDNIDTILSDGKVIIEHDKSFVCGPLAYRNNRFNKNKFTLLNTPKLLYLHRFSSDTDDIIKSLIVTRECALIYQRMMHNYPPIEITVKLVNVQCSAAKNTLNAANLPLNPVKSHSVTVQNSECLTWEKLYYIDRILCARHDGCEYHPCKKN